MPSISLAIGHVRAGLTSMTTIIGPGNRDAVGQLLYIQMDPITMVVSAERRQTGAYN
ncbi:hypothetical protein [Aurantiacibacter marinus]|nr:hypothetical protein [Aurantiacibacter marinus]